MTSHNDADGTVVQRIAYIYHPSDDEDESATTSRRKRQQKDEGRAKKRRRMQAAKPVQAAQARSSLAAFPPLLQGREAPEAVSRRSELYSALWGRMESRIKNALLEANKATLDALLGFIEEPIRTSAADQTKLPTAFVVLGPAAANDVLLFEHLAESVDTTGTGDDDSNDNNKGFRRMVRLLAADASNLKGALRAIVQGVVGSRNDDEEEQKYDGLPYDLEAVYARVRAAKDPAASRIVVALEDAEAFDSALLADLLSFLHTWRDRIPFVLVIGVATSVDLFQARLPKVVVSHRLAASAATQFDVAPSAAVIDQLLRLIIASVDITPRIGPRLLQALLERQEEQIAGPSMFAASVKYAYMSYFYANPLAVLVDSTPDPQIISKDIVTCIRHSASFQRHVEELVEAGHIAAARALLESDEAVRSAVVKEMAAVCRRTIRLIRGVHLAASSGLFTNQSFSDLYLTALRETIYAKNDTEEEEEEEATLAETLTSGIRRMTSSDLAKLARRLAESVQKGDDSLGLAPAESNVADVTENDQEAWRLLVDKLPELAGKIESLEQRVASQAASKGRGTRTGAAARSLRSKYTAQSKVLRTTVVAQKVQLSHDTAALTPEDEEFTELVDAVVDAVVAWVRPSPGEEDFWLEEAWLYDACTPYRDVFIPRPGLVMERALSRPHDYLACSCCGGEKSGQTGKSKKRGSKADTLPTVLPPTLPATAILYRMYQEAGPLINVADLWSAFRDLVSGDGDGDGDGDAGDKDDEDEDGESEEERRHLVQFYQGLSELKALGFVKATRKKTDHVAKVRWL